MRAQRSNWLHHLLPRRRVVFAAGAIVAVSVALLAVEFASARHNRTIFGNDLGGDFPAFYVAGNILAQRGPDRLYDQGLQSRLYHELIPGNPPNVSLPYAYPPAVAAAMRPLACCRTSGRRRFGRSFPRCCIWRAWASCGLPAETFRREIGCPPPCCVLPLSRS